MTTRSVAVIFVSVLALVGNADAGTFLRADPDTKCSDAYRKDQSKEVCLDTKDHYLRPCEYCTDKQGNVFCYNADEARWAKFFGCNCEVKSESRGNEAKVE
eukprot:CAMPEP_0183292380 /NCGR_PEP_ID=MMETSP0160_2-20130417/1455_1 /TAXON_ID=2839 ORGANISM="Odontella Sinensis, Strain Grunow 1884" /NCGR_SAMPLE_ID=MMETSP0160_2 /ASSEMBLY_ACC=CAM_ASM_000250 /LENGTH=100 /DNA_ID=CAMNT_0025453323 /DNA_START=112 /DNA_END=414 /DNA_ORIENTATION=+